MKTFTFSVPTWADAKAQYNTTREAVKVRAEVRKAKAEAKRTLRGISERQLNDLAAEIIKSRGL